MISKLYILNNTNIICHTEMNQDTQMTQMLAKFENEYPWGYMEKFPEYCVNKINNIGVGNHKFDNIPEDALENLLEVGLRTRAHIIEWMTKYLTYESLMYIGW